MQWPWWTRKFWHEKVQKKWLNDIGTFSFWLSFSEETTKSFESLGYLRETIFVIWLTINIKFEARKGLANAQSTELLWKFIQKWPLKWLYSVLVPGVRNIGNNLVKVLEWNWIDFDENLMIGPWLYGREEVNYSFILLLIVIYYIIVAKPRNKVRAQRYLTPKSKVLWVFHNVRSFKMRADRKINHWREHRMIFVLRKKHNLVWL